MRKILFKGISMEKSKYQEWVEGDLNLEKDNNGNEYPVINNDNSIFSFKIYPETLCQLTEFKDKNNNEIWEHDLLKSLLYGIQLLLNFYHPILLLFSIKEYGSDVILYLSTYNKLILEKIGNKYDKDKINKEKYKII